MILLLVKIVVSIAVFYLGLFIAFKGFMSPLFDKLYNEPKASYFLIVVTFLMGGMCLAAAPIMYWIG